MTKIKSLADIPSVRAYLKRINAEPRSLRSAVVVEKAGKYWQDIAVIHFDAEGGVEAPKRFAPTDEEKVIIASEFKIYQWPQIVHLKQLKNLPDHLEKADPESIFEFRNAEGDITMIQHRIDTDSGKAYVPYTYWDDQEWRAMEPEGKLPLWGLDQLEKNSTVFIHEGAKAARHIANMVKGELREQKAALKKHPWGEELGNAAHVGWIGGALSPYRTDWSALKKAGIKKAYIVADNDSAGLAAVPNIAMMVRVPTFLIQFTGEWPPSFDLADEFPDEMFKEIDGVKHYVGPAFDECLHPATWATDKIPQDNGKPLLVLREHFKDIWAYIEEIDRFICLAMPEIIRKEQVLNKMLSPFSHSKSTAPMIASSFRGRKLRLCYRPDKKKRIITDKGNASINLHKGANIKPIKGDPGPWLDFLQYMFPKEEERYEMMRYIATLIARPDIRMLYGLLLVSEMQGVGKTTLASRVLAPLVGDKNCSFPSEKQIVDNNFNEWIAQKRLVVVAEIYSGHSWKAYNTLKGYITDKEITVNQKFMDPYRIENWAHIVASSNSRKALKMENNDRRWFYPQVTEVKWPSHKFQEFNDWIDSGGLGIILQWAMDFDDYVNHYEEAPMTELKQQMIEDSLSEAEKEVAELARMAVATTDMVAFGMSELRSWLENRSKGPVFASDYELRKILKDNGMHQIEKRIKVDKRLQYVLVTPPLYEKVQAMEDEERNKIIRDLVAPPSQYFSEIF